MQGPKLPRSGWKAIPSGLPKLPPTANASSRNFNCAIPTTQTSRKASPVTASALTGSPSQRIALRRPAPTAIVSELTAHATHSGAWLNCSPYASEGRLDPPPPFLITTKPCADYRTVAPKPGTLTRLRPQLGTVLVGLSITQVQLAQAWAGPTCRGCVVPAISSSVSSRA
jgi:hypothetical protein